MIVKPQLFHSLVVLIKGWLAVRGSGGGGVGEMGKSEMRRGGDGSGGDGEMGREFEAFLIDLNRQFKCAIACTGEIF